MSPGASADQVAYYVQLLNKVRALPEWQEFMAQGAFSQTVLTGEPFVAWLEKAESFHRLLMREAKLTYVAASPAAAAAPKAAAAVTSAAPTPAKK